MSYPANIFIPGGLCIYSDSINGYAYDLMQYKLVLKKTKKYPFKGRGTEDAMKKKPLPKKGL